LTTALIDAENVRRSVWPNISREELVELVRAWAEHEEVRAVVVFDGGEPTEEERSGVLVVHTGGEIADDWIAREAERYRLFWLVTSDRELRERVADAERVVGGGSFLREISAR